MTSPAYLLKLKAVIHEMALLFNQYPGDQRIHAYAVQLQKFTPEQIKFSFQKEIDRGSAFFPSLAELLAHLRPVEISPDALAAKVAQEIMDTVCGGESFSTLSELAKSTLGSESAFRRICSSPESQIPTRFAQIRGMAKAEIETERQRKHDVELEKLGLPVGKVLELKRPKDALPQSIDDPLKEVHHLATEEINNELRQVSAFLKKPSWLDFSLAKKGVANVD